MGHPRSHLRAAAISTAAIAATLVLAACGTSDPNLGAGESVEPTPTVPITWTESASPVATADYCGYEEPIVDPSMRGTPDIRPSRTPEPGQPAFTEGDVRAWVAAMESDENPVVKRVEFMSACEVATRIQHSVGEPDDALLALVTLTGNWIPSLPPGVKLVGTPIPGTVAYWIFDATGHLIARTYGVQEP